MDGYAPRPIFLDVRVIDRASSFLLLDLGEKIRDLIRGGGSGHRILAVWMAEYPTADAPDSKTWDTRLEVGVSGSNLGCVAAEKRCRCRSPHVRGPAAQVSLFPVTHHGSDGNRTV